MIEPDFDELGKITYHALERLPREEEAGGKMLFAVVSVAVSVGLTVIAYAANHFEHSPLLVSAVIGIGILCGLVVASTAAITTRLGCLQRHLITVHEELLRARADIVDRH
jgi:hypothetical protein